MFVSDRNGVYNLFVLNLATREERPITNDVRGVFQYHVSSDGERAALVTLLGATPSIYLIPTPFDRRVEDEALWPNVCAQRIGNDYTAAPVTTAASACV